MMNGERALVLWETAAKAVRERRLAAAEEIAAKMHIPSDARLIREMSGWQRESE